MATRKRGRSTPEWAITFDDTVSLRCIVESAAAVMSRVIFRVAKIDGSFSLMVDGADMGFTCCVSARLQLDKVSFPGGANGLSEFTFCIDCKQVLYSIDIPSFAHGCLTMEGHTSSATVHLIMADPSQKTSEVCSVLKTFVDGPPPQSLCALDYKMMLEIDVPRLREIVKMARKARAEHLSICIYTRVIGCQERSLVIFAVQGESDHEEIFFNEMTRHEDGSLIVRASPDGLDEQPCDMQENECVFEGVFQIEKIDAFVKNIPVRTIDARVQSGMPLMLTHKLAAGDDEQSHVRFLVAPRGVDE